MVADEHLMAADQSFSAASGMRRDVLGRDRGNVRRGRMVEDRLRDRMRGPLLDRRSEADDGRAR